MTPARNPTPREHEILTKLLTARFPQVGNLRSQLEGLIVQVIDENESLRLLPQRGEPAAVSKRIPVEAETPDDDGALIHLLLHVVDGRLHELEIYREDSGQVKHPPTAEHLEIIVLG